MEIKATHDLHRRRLSRNVGVGLALLGFVAIMFGLTIAKISSGDRMEGFDHALRPGLIGGDTK